MRKFSASMARNGRYTATAKRIVSCIFFTVLAGLAATFLSVSCSHRKPERSHLSSLRQKGSEQSDTEGNNNVGELVQAQPRFGSPERNDSNDGSCIQLKNRYPDLSPDGAHKIKRKRFAVVTYSDGNGSKTGHYCKVRANHCAYAELDGDADCIDNRNLERCVDRIALQSFHFIHPAAWAKVSLLQHCCRHYEYALLLDADLIVMDPEKYPLERFVREAEAKNKDLTFTGTGVEKTPINSGLIGIRCATASSLETKDESRIGEEFLSKTLENSRSTSWRMNGLWEQRTMRKLYLENQKYREGILLLPEKETQCYPKGGECSGDEFSVHFLGDKSKYERQFLRYFCESRMSSETVDAIRENVC